MINLSDSALVRWCMLILIVLANSPNPACGDEKDTETGDGKQAPDQPLPASDEGLQAMQGFRKPADWTVSLFAAEPRLANPVAFTVDNLGRVFVCESFRQDRGVTDNRGHDQEWLLADLAAQSVQDRIDYHRRLLGEQVAEYTAHDDRVRMLVDSDGDGQADRDTVFADGFNALEDGTGAGVLARGHDVYYTCIPKLWLLKDVDDDGQADERQALHDGFGVRVAFRGHDLHGLVIGPDGRLYFSIGDRGYNIETPGGRLKNTESGAVFRCEMDGSNLEVFATGLRNPQELAFDDFGYLFTGDNNSDSGDQARWVNVMQGGDSGWRMMYQYLPDRGPFNREKIWQPYSLDTPAYIVPPIANIGDGPSGLTCYPGTGLTGDFANCFFMVDFRGGASNSGIRLIRTQPAGAFWEIERSEQPIWNMLATDATFGPDGTLWVSDWVNGWVGEGKGRIYRFADTTAQQSAVVQEVRELLAAGFTELDPKRLGELLQHADRRVRLEAQWELAKRGRTEEFQAVLAANDSPTLPQLHAVWGLGHAARLQPELRGAAATGLQTALASDDVNVRSAAANVIGDLRLKKFAGEIVALVNDAAPRVRYAASLAAGNMRLDAALEPVCQMLAENADADPGLRHAGIMALKGVTDPQALLSLQQHASPSVRLAAVVALRKLRQLGIEAFVQDADPRVQLEAVRAIHDVPELHAVLPAVAELIDHDLTNEAVAHRVLNAVFRLNGPHAAEQLAIFAGHPQHADALRIEAIDMLGTWAEPGQLDRVMNRYLPLPERDVAPARAAFESKLANILAGSDAVVERGIAAASQLGIKQAAELLRGLASNADNEPALRSSALRALANLERSDALPLIQELARDGKATVRATALSLLADLAPAAAIPWLRTAVDSNASGERQAAWDALARIESPEATKLIESGVQRYIDGNLPPDVWLNVTEAAAGRVSEALAGQLQEYEAQVAAGDPLETYRTAAFGGDVARGRQLFFNKTELSCVRCHKVGEVGGEVGPVLTQIGKAKDNRYLLESIVDPDAKIAENFETVVLLTEDDQIIAGILRKETPSIIELINADGKIIEIDPVDVVSRKKGKSAMPADLLKSLTRRELRDLVAYLSSLK